MTERSTIEGVVGSGRSGSAPASSVPADASPAAALPDDGTPDLPPPDPRAAGDAAVREACEQRPDRARLIEAYFRHVPGEDRPRRAVDVLGIIDGHLRVADRRPAGTAAMRFFNPAQGADPVGWSSTSTVIDLVNDDMPYLVDSIIGALTAGGLTVHRVLHPILAVRRDPAGKLLEVVGESRRGIDPVDCVRESWVHVLIDRLSDAERAESLESDLSDVLQAVRTVVTDSQAIVGAAAIAAAELRTVLSPRSTQEVSEASDLLTWFTAGHLMFLGYRCFEAGPDGALVSVRGSGLGLLREDLNVAARFELDRTDRVPGHLVLAQASESSAVSRGVPPLSVIARILSLDGRVLREHRFLGVLTPRAQNAEVTTTPVLRQTVAKVLAELGAVPDSYTGQRAMELLSTYPRAELFWADADGVAEIIGGVLQLSSRRRLRAFLQPDPFGRFVSVLVFLPRDRYTTASRLAMQQVLLDTLHGTAIRYTARIGDSLLAAVHFTVATDPARPVSLTGADQARMQRALRATIRTWGDRLVSAVVGGRGEEDLDTAAALTRYADAFDESYKEHYGAEDAVADLRRLDALTDQHDLALAFGMPGERRDPGDPAVHSHPAGTPGADGTDEKRLKLYVTGGTVTLSRALPVLQSMGAEVIDERPYDVRRTDGTPSRIYDFGLRFPESQLRAGEDVVANRDRFTQSFIAAWRSLAEVDGFNALVLSAGLDWRQVSVLRAYAHYLRQVGSPYTQGYLEQVLGTHPAITADLAALFAVRFDPDAYPAAEFQQRDRDGEELANRISAALDQVASLDADRILRTYLGLILATVRTNFYRTDDGRLAAAIAFKLVPKLIPGIPKPVPAHEVWVYSPRVEGVHLRFGRVARGGLRWSDRPEDFRTEILGLVKAQEVKNAVIVPVGAKGGFVVKQPPVPTGEAAADREVLTAEGVACYRIFISSLLDVTDNRVVGEVVPPDRVVRHDDDDPYLVVAADKGTASFSDIANEIAVHNGFWLGDAFASGGSAGYDHKAMGITARGAWESVKHHFRELGVNTQTENFTCVGVGDMSGDVFGNGMLASRHIRLLAAFDHRHVFVDPDPGAAVSFEERKRLFGRPRSSWGDYDPTVISFGGGVWPRTAKSIPLNPQIRAALGIPDTVAALAPTDLIRAILLAPADLLWNGGIGTYIKAESETNAEVGDKNNDAVRVNGGELRAKVVGEGGNLGVTQLGRVEFARAGGRINTDAIDNSAGVDTSDHEVNIKIALQQAIADGSLAADERDPLLESMTDEVADLVLADNIAQNRVLGVSRDHSVPMLSVHARLIDALVSSGRLDRDLEFLPSRKQIEARTAAGEGLTSPELAVLLAYVKADLSDAMLADDLPDDPVFAALLPSYFPETMSGPGDWGQRLAESIGRHPLAREIVTTMVVNEVVNGAGISYAFRLAEEMGASRTDAIRAYAVTTAVFDLDEMWRAIASLDNKIPAGCQDTLYLEIRRLLDRGARWLLIHRPHPLPVGPEVARYAGAVRDLTPRMPRLLCGDEHDNVRSDADRLMELGAPAELANRVAYSLYTFSVLDIVDIATETDHDLGATAELYFALSAHLDFDRVLSAVSALQRGDRWHALARQAIRDDLYISLRQITAHVLTTTPDDLSVGDRMMQWEQENAVRLDRARATLGQIASGSAGDLAALSVAANQVRSMIG